MRMGRGAGEGRRQRINRKEGGMVVGSVFGFQKSFRGFSVSISQAKRMHKPPTMILKSKSS